MKLSLTIDEVNVNVREKEFRVKGFNASFEATEGETISSYDALKVLGGEFMEMNIAQIQSLDKSIDKNAETVVEKVKVTEEPKKKTIEEKIAEANKKIKETFNDANFDKMVEKLEDHYDLCFKVDKFFKDGRFKQIISDCVAEQIITPECKEILKMIIIDVMDYPLFTLVNLGKLTEQTTDEHSNFLFGYLHMIANHCCKIDKNLGCLETSKIIYSMMKDVLGQAIRYHQDPWLDDDEW